MDSNNFVKICKTKIYQTKLFGNTFEIFELQKFLFLWNFENKCANAKCKVMMHAMYEILFLWKIGMLQFV